MVVVEKRATPVPPRFAVPILVTPSISVTVPVGMPVLLVTVTLKVATRPARVGFAIEVSVAEVLVCVTISLTLPVLPL